MGFSLKNLGDVVDTITDPGSAITGTPSVMEDLGLAGKKGGKGGKSDRDDALDQAESIINDSVSSAIEALQAGQAEAAAATIEAAKIGAKAVLDAAEMGIESQERFFAVADKKLTPFIDQGVIAGDELASMLGIPNSEGKLVPYDLDKLRETPGYQFVFDETVEGVLRSAIGSKLSSGTTDRIQDRAGGLAEQTFNTRAKLLGNTADRGARAGSALGQIASNFGGNVANIANMQGRSQAQIFSNQGEQLSNIFTNTATGIAGLERDLGSTLAELELVRGKVSPFFNNQDRGMSTGQAVMGGATIGSAFGPWGAAIGAGAGFIGDKVGIF